MALKVTQGHQNWPLFCRRYITSY